MGWKFWQRNEEEEASKHKLPKPKELPDRIGRYMVVEKKMDPDYVWGLKCALRPHSQGQTSFAFRVFNDNTSQNAGVRVLNFDSLDAHPELIILQGRFDKRSNEIEIQKEG